MKLNSILFEEFSNSFSEFLSISDSDPDELYEKRLEWLKNHYKFLGAGVSRRVFDFDENKVIKLSDIHNDQNVNEIKVFQCFGTQYTLKIYKSAPDHTWIIVEKVKPFKNDEEMIAKFQDSCGITPEKWDSFKKEMGLTRDAFILLFLLREDMRVKNLGKYIKKTSSWFSGLVKIVRSCKVSPNDLYDDNLGIASDGRFVIVDAGNFEILEEQNAVGGGGIVGYTAPLGSRGIGSDNKLEKGFWRDKAGKKVKTGSPELDKDIKETVQAVGTPTDDLNMIKGLYKDDKEKGISIKEIIEEETKDLMSKMG